MVQHVATRREAFGKWLRREAEVREGRIPRASSLAVRVGTRQVQGVITRGEGQFHRRSEIIARLEPEADGWLMLDANAREACLRADHALDALVVALVACAAAVGETVRPDISQRGVAQREGWIHSPEPESLSRLASASV